MRRLFAVTLVLLLVLSLAGCEKFGVEDPFGEIGDPFVDRNPNETEIVPQEQPSTLPAVETEPPTDPTQPPVPQVTVSDAYVDTLTVEGYDGPETYCYHIPRFDIDSPETESLNRAIYMELYEILERSVYADPEYPFVYGMYYDWIQVENIVSLLVYVQCDWSISMYKVYHAYADGSGVLRQEELISSFGYDDSSFYALAAQKLEEKYLAIYAEYPYKDTDTFYQMQYENTIREENVRRVLPYISANGDLCCVATIYSLAGADAYDYLVNLTGTSDPKDPTCGIDHG